MCDHAKISPHNSGGFDPAIRAARSAQLTPSSNPPTKESPSDNSSPLSCGTSGGKDTSHLQAARSLAQSLHKSGAKLVFGGGTSGLMGEVAKELVRLSGPSAVHGIIPNALMAFERKYTNAEDCEANGMSEQKQKDDEMFGRGGVQ